MPCQPDPSAQAPCTRTTEGWDPSWGFVLMASSFRIRFFQWRVNLFTECMVPSSALWRELRRIPIPRTWLNKGKRKVPVIGWGDHDNCRGRFPLPCAERLDPRVVLPLGRSVVGHPKPHAHKSYVAQGLGIHSHIHIRPDRFAERRHGCLVYR